MNKTNRILLAAILLAGALPTLVRAQVEAAGVTPQNDRLVAEEQKYWAMEDLPIPWNAKVEATSFVELKGGRIALGTRRGEIYLVDGIDRETPNLDWHLFATGLHEVLGLAEKDGVLYATQQCEVTRILDTNADGLADRFETLSDGWGYGNEHEFTFGSGFDREGNIWVVHCLSGSYTSENLFRGWCLRITPDGRTIPTCSGMRSPGGVGFDPQGVAFYTESQGPWNGSCSIKQLRPGGFLGHPISFKWYSHAPNLGAPPKTPKGGRDVRQHVVAREIPELVTPAIVFPYKKMGQSASGLVLDRSGGRFGPFRNQFFVGDYTLGLVMRVHMEKVDGIYQGACFPFRQGFNTGVIGVLLTRGGHLVTGGCARGWPTRGTVPYSLQRLRWTGKKVLEVLEMNARHDGFELVFTEPVDPKSALDPGSYALTTYTYRYQKVYGSPEVDHTKPTISNIRLSEDRLRVRFEVDGLQVGHVHELHLPGVRDAGGGRLLHDVAYYTLNVIPKE